MHISDISGFRTEFEILRLKIFIFLGAAPEWRMITYVFDVSRLKCVTSHQVAPMQKKHQVRRTFIVAGTEDMERKAKEGATLTERTRRETTENMVINQKL